MIEMEMIWLNHTENKLKWENKEKIRNILHRIQSQLQIQIVFMYLVFE